MSDSFLSDTEFTILSESTLHRRTPYVFSGVIQSQLSVARHYGGCTYNGETYVYQPATDELIRDDVMVFVRKLRRKPKEKASQQERGLFDE